MGKEIERKWMLAPHVDYKEIIEQCGYKEIKDYYFNPYTRLRCVDGTWCITIKSEGTLIRDEFEFEIDKSQIDFLPTPMMIKKRYMKYVGDNIFEINVFENLWITPEINPKPLVIVECEFKDENINVKLPDFLGTEVTQLKMFYGYELFERLKESMTEV